MLLNFSCSYFWLQGWIPPCRKQQLLWRSSRVSGYGAFLHIQPAPSWLCRAAWPQLLHDVLSSRHETLTLEAIRLLCKPWLHYRWFVQVTLSSSWIRVAHRREMCNDPITRTVQEALFLPPMSHCFPSFLALPRDKTVTSCTFSDSDSPTCNSYPKSSDKHVQNSPHSRSLLHHSDQWHNPHSLTPQVRCGHRTNPPDEAADPCIKDSTSAGAHTSHRRCQTRRQQVPGG